MAPLSKRARKVVAVVDGDLAHLGPRLGRQPRAAAGLGRHRTLLDEGRHRADDLRDRPDEVEPEIGDVRRDVAQGAGAGQLLLQPPDEREVGVGDPVLEIDRPPVPHLADGAVVDQLLGELHRGHLAVVVVDDRDGARLPRRLQHLARLGEIVRQRFLADDVLPGRQRGQHDVLVGIARGRDVDELDIRPLHQRVVVGLVPLPAERLAPPPSPPPRPARRWPPSAAADRRRRNARPAGTHSNAPVP